MTSADNAVNDNVAIDVAGLAKRYEIYDTPRDRLKQLILPRLQGAIGLPRRCYFREFWALHDVSFRIKRGECVGIMGRNGAGKSTLLQLICGTLKPTAGTVVTRGRIAALLELGAGFNPEFTGRENVYLNGILLGLDHDEVDRRFDEIAAFADIGEFLDQPVKTYSSGMYVRLAFAVQSCVAPDILIVDEALAVGDIGFQYKCYQHMRRLRDSGVTILMVTHASGSILEYASRCIVLDRGAVTRDTSKVLEAVLAYEKGLLPIQVGESRPVAKTLVHDAYCSAAELERRRDSSRNKAEDEQRFGTARAIIDQLTVRRATDSPDVDCAMVKTNDDVVFTFRLLSAERIKGVVLGISLSLAKGVDVWGDNNLHAGESIDLDVGELWVEYRTRLPISAGEYLIHCGIACFNGDRREELDQRRPMRRLRVWSSREQVGVVYAPVTVVVLGGGR